MSIDEAHADQIEKALGISLARQKDMRAYSHLSRIASSSDAAVREWTIRAALLEQNWQHVNAALQRLSDDEKRAPQWQYWMARALQETGRNVQAEEAFEQIAQDRSFYGFLAADHTGRTYQIGDRPAPASTGDIDAIRTRRSFRIVEEFRALGRNGDAAQQWWFAVGQLDKHHKMLAAKLAQQWGWHPVAIFTLARADYWDDINLRFPLVYPNQIKHYAAMHDLRPALVYGLVRQESVFDTNAYSSAGARGLMQLMPETGQHIAKQFNERWRSASDLFDPEINLKYGTFYYKQLLERFDGNAALAAAGYNAGPNRVFRWRPYLRPVPADVWIETIPFKETRKYVSSVLTYSVIYQYRLGLGNLKLKDLIPDVYPG